MRDRRKLTRQCLGSLLFLLAGCSTPLAVQVIRYPGSAALPERTYPCDLRFLEANATVPKGCEDIGDAFVGDSGLTHYCDEGDVKSALRAVACKAGAQAVVVRPINDPDSSCHQIRARLLHCPGGVPAL